MGTGLLDSDFISANDLNSEYFLKKGKEIDVRDLLKLPAHKIYFHLSYSNGVLKLIKNNPTIFHDEVSIYFSLIDPSGEFIVSYNDFSDILTGIAPKIINSNNEVYNFSPFNLSAKVAYKQEIKRLFKIVERYHIGLSDNINFCGFFRMISLDHDKEDGKFKIHFNAKYNLLENKFTSNNSIDEVAILSISLCDVDSTLFFKEILNLDSIYHLKSDISYLLKKYNAENENANKALERRSKLNNEINQAKEETYKQIIAGLICCLNPNLKYEKNKKLRTILKSNGSYNCNAIKDNIVLALDKLKKDGKIVDNIRKDTIIRDYLTEIIKEIEYK